jgi:CRP/FNR family cyclic AMP-dependent transcriptional regulator
MATRTSREKLESSTDGAKMAEALRRCKLFHDLEDEQIRMLATAFHEESHKQGEAIFRQGDLGRKLYVIAQGQVLLERTLDMKPRVANVALSLLGKDRVMGCWACLVGELRDLRESAICQKPTKVLAAEGSELANIMEENPQIALVLLKRLCFMLDERLHDCYCTIGSL